MNDGKSKPPAPHGERRRATDQPARTRARNGGVDAYGNWLDGARKSGDRHSAITRTLYNWSSYKSWADRMRSSWDTEK